MAHILTDLNADSKPLSKKHKAMKTEAKQSHREVRRSQYPHKRAEQDAHMAPYSIHTPYSKMAAIFVFFCFHAN